MANSDEIDSEGNNPAFEAVNDKLAELDQVLEHPDATGDASEALAAMKQLAQELFNAIQGCSLKDFEQEYPLESEAEEEDEELMGGIFS